MEQALFHVVLGDKRIGPYDRRTIVGMRIKDALTSDHVLIDTNGAELTVADLIGRKPATPAFNPGRSGGYSIVQATYPGSLVAVQGRGLPIPRFRGEIEIRVQGEVLRIAGRFRSLAGWKEDRTKLPLQDVVHARVRGSQVDLWLRPQGKRPPQRLTLELFTPESAGELVEWLPAAKPWPEGAPSRPGALPAAGQTSQHLLWVSVGSMALVLAVVLGVLMYGAR